MKTRIRGQVSSPEALRLLMQGQAALAAVEQNGIRIDTAYLDRTLAETQERIADYERRLKADPLWAEWKKYFHGRGKGRPAAKLTSREQLATMLFDVQGYSPPPLTDHTLELIDAGERDVKKRYRSDVEVLNKVDLPFCRDYVAMQKLIKVKTTYLEGIKREVVGEIARPIFGLTTAVTYRSSSSLFNFQNIPVRDPAIAEIVRRCYIPRKGNVIVEVDFSGIEVRVACCYTHDPRLISDFTEPGKDPHRDTASELFLLPLKFLIEHKDWTKKGVRDWAKNRFVFPQFYGSNFVNCAPALWEGVTDTAHPGATLPDGTPLLEHLRRKGIKELGLREAEGNRIKTDPGTFMDHVRLVEERFWNERFKVYTDWKRRFYEAYRKEGGFRTLTGFYLRGNFGKNDVLNYPIQGSAFHCLLWSLVRLQRWIEKHKQRAKLVGQIHDSIVADVPIVELDDYLNAARHIMTVALPKAWDWIIVPLDTEAEVAPEEQSWFFKRQWVPNGDGEWRPKG